MKSLFLCPVCKKPLLRGAAEYVCENGHVFDRSKKGYVNLFLNNSAGSHGDNREMLEARRAFLRAGHYDFLSEAAEQILSECVPQNGVLLDVGCGEGYYTERFRNALTDRNASVFGTDISKTALTIANGKKSGIEYAVATNAALPVSDRSADAVSALFTPVYVGEIARVLKIGGKFLHVAPAPDHLMGLKRVLYETPYENELQRFDSEDLRFDREVTVRRETALCREDAKNLFHMTPYYYKTAKSAQEKLDAIETLLTEFSFVLTLYVRK